MSIRQVFLLLFVVVAAGLAGFLLARQLREARSNAEPATPPPGVLAIGDLRPTLSLPDLSGTTVDLSRFDGKPVLLNFWASWCPPCVEEMPLLSRFYTQTKDNGWQMLGLAIDQVDLVQRFLARTPVSYPIAMAGPTGVEWTKKLGNAAGGLPFTVVFDRQGAIQHRKLGQLKPEDLAAWLR